MGTSLDTAILVEAIKAARQFVAAPAWRDYIISEFGEFSQAKTDEEIVAYARANSDTVDHLVGTAAMGPRGREGGALNPDLTVKGTVGLRVVDASAFVSHIFWLLCRKLRRHPPQPFIISGHTQAPTYILAERAADLVKERKSRGH